MTTLMASTISTLTCSCSSSSTNTKSSFYSPSTSAVLCSRTANFGHATTVAPLGLSLFSPWNGLRHLGISISQKSLRTERKGRCKGKGVYASLFGVGAPEALVIGVVALLVFGPKGLAEVARNLGKTLRAFQPTIRELQDVSREFKSTLEREIGLDDISSSPQNTYSSKTSNTASTPSSTTSTEDSRTVVDPNGAPSANRAYTSEEYLKFTEEQLKASASQQQGQTPPLGDSQFEPQTQPLGSVQEAAPVITPTKKPENET
ncbi:hypothetical protein L1049_021356 [Liquidambar formosana]|uniref:Sec-independent protein translocase protein TATB, chloroplastic n=1 Tax=Liquidambar formosana TaxID=63359 RepID=A0AAP0X523_LIQFO